MKRRPTLTFDPRFQLIAERFASLTQVAYDGVLIYHSGVILDATPGAAALFGRAPQELDQRAVADLIDSESKSTLIRHLESAVRTACPAVALRGDGSKLPIEMSVQASLTVNGRRVQVVALRDASSDDQQQYLTDLTFRRRPSLGAEPN
jgi:PAS domain S-box-containing protein